MTDSKKSIDDKERVINSTDSDDKPQHSTIGIHRLNTIRHSEAP